MNITQARWTSASNQGVPHVVCLCRWLIQRDGEPLRRWSVVRRKQRQVNRQLLRHTRLVYTVRYVTGARTWLGCDHVTMRQLSHCPSFRNFCLCLNLSPERTLKKNSGLAVKTHDLEVRRTQDYRCGSMSMTRGGGCAGLDLHFVNRKRRGNCRLRKSMTFPSFWGYVLSAIDWRGLEH
jgi:hypothetical protein